MNEKDILKAKKQLAKLVEVKGFFKVAEKASLSPSTLGIYLDTANTRFLSPTKLQLITVLLG